MKLRAEELVKKYKSRTVVKGVSVNVEQGEIVGLLGPNGAGKTTSFYMIVGLIKPNGGRIFLDDTEITTEPVYRRAQLGVGYLAQEASVFRQLSVEDNIKAVLEMSKCWMSSVCSIFARVREFNCREESVDARKLRERCRLLRNLSYWTNLLLEWIRLPWRIFRAS